MVSDDLTPYQGIPLPTRRQFLRSLLGAGTVAGTAGVASQVRFGSVEARRPEPDTWPRPGYDAADSAFNPAASPPVDPAVGWSRAVPDDGPTGSRALVVGPDAVYASGDRVVAFDRADGGERWQGDARVSSLALGDGRLYVGVEGLDTLRALSTAGEQRWEVSGDRERIFDILPTTERVLVGSGDSVAAHDPADGSELWRSDRERGGLVVAGERLYTGLPNPRQLSTRSLLDRLLSDPPGIAWEVPVGSANVVGTEGGIVVGHDTYDPDRDDGEQAVLGAYTASGKRRWQVLPGEGLDGESAVSLAAATGDRLLASVETTAGADTVDSYRLDDGDRLWRRRLDHEVRDLAVVDGAVLLATDSDGKRGPAGTVRALDAADGRERWRVGLEAPVATLAPVDGTVFALTEDRLLVAIR